MKWASLVIFAMLAIQLAACSRSPKAAATTRSAGTNSSTVTSNPAQPSQASPSATGTPVAPSPLPAQSKPQPATAQLKTALVAVSVASAAWYDDRYHDALAPPKGGRTILVIMKLANRSRSPIHYAASRDLAVSVLREGGTKEEVFGAKGIAIDQAFMWKGTPEGIALKTKSDSGWVGTIALDPESNYGTHVFFPSGAFDLAIQPGGKFELPVFFAVPRRFKSLTLQAKGARPVSFTISK